MDKPNYYGILTADVRYDKDLIPMAKVLYAEISALSNKNGCCSASNSYFSALYEVSDKTICSWVKSLSDKGYIYVDHETTYIDKSKHYQKRVIFIDKQKFIEYKSMKEEQKKSSKVNYEKVNYEKVNIYNNIKDYNNTSNFNKEKINKKESTTNEENSVVAKATVSKFKSKYGLSFTSDDTQQGDKLLDDYLQVFSTKDKEHISSLLIEFIKLRKDKRKPIITLRMLKGIINNLKALKSPTTADYVAKKIELTLDRGWLDVKEYENSNYNVNKHVDTRPSADDNDYSTDIDVIFKRK